MHLSVLGPLRLAIDDQEVEVPGTKRRGVLAMLAMAAPEPVHADRLVDAIWPDEPPASGRAALQSHISRLRRHLGPYAARLTNTGSGYRLHLENRELDAAEALTLIHQARSAPDGGGARQLLEDARRLWRGEALADLLDVEPLRAWSRSLTEEWFSASELLIHRALASDDADRAVVVAADVIASDPLREAGVVLLVRALAAQGRTADALRVAHDFRRRLRDETGLDPSPRLGEVERLVASRSAPPHRSSRTDASSPALAPRPAELLGRGTELADIARLIASERLVTLLGPGGVGKTHLALEAARRASDGRAVTLVPLAGVTDASAIADVLARVLGLEIEGDDLRGCALRLQSGRQLLLIDNCEHLLAGVRGLVATLLTACPDLTILATSREPLGLAEEQPLRIPPLPTPELDQGDVAAVPSVALFLARARRARSGSVEGAGALDSVARIVRALDGVPLAIELAAGRLSALTLHDLEARLDRALDLLGQAREHTTAVDPRHRTLRAAIGWSYDLLPDSEQQLFRNLAAFPDGFDLETAENLAREIGSTDDPAMAFAHLVDASLVVADLDGIPRYRMLDALRRFGLDRLEVAGELEPAMSRLVAWALGTAHQLSLTGESAEEARADAQLRAELGNLRTAWRAARIAGDVEAAASLVLDLYPAVSWRDTTEVWRWALELAEDPELVGRACEAGTLAVAAEAAWMSRGDLDRAEALALRSVELADPGDAPVWSLCTWALASVRLFRGRYPEARELALATVPGARWPAAGHVQAALASAYGGDLPGARELLARADALDAYPTLDGYRRYAWGEVANLSADWATAEPAYRDAIAVAATTNATFLEGIASVGLVSALAACGEVRDALIGYSQLIGRWEQTGGWTQQWTTLRNLATLLDGLGDGTTAALLRDVAASAPEAAGTGPLSRDGPAGGRREGRPDRQWILGTARAAIDRALVTQATGS